MNFIKKKIFFIIAIFTSLLVGCNSFTNSGYVDVQQKLMALQTYSSQAKITYISNKGQNEYEINIYGKKTGEYRIETLQPDAVAGNIIIFDGNMVWQYNPNVDSKISVGMPDKVERTEISIFNFLQNHLKSKDVSVETASQDDSVYTILEAQIPEGNKFFSTEKLWLNNETKSPEKLIIYDTEGVERVVVEYSNFEFNPELDESLFKIDQIYNQEQKE